MGNIGMFNTRSVLAAIILISVSTAPSIAKDYCEEFFCIRTIETNNSVRFIGINKDKNIPVSTALTLKLENATADKKKPFRYVVAPGETKTLFTVNANDNGRWRYNFRYFWRYGDYEAKHDSSVKYLLPVKPGSKVRISQGCNQKFSHNGKRGNATDFTIKTGTAIHAARGGVVISTKQDSNKGGRTRTFGKFANHIYILHDDDTFGIYLHLKKDGVAVDVGQTVEAGELIGYSGNTGWSTQPHLHFEVIKPENTDKLEWASIKITYQTSNGPVSCPHNTNLKAKRL